jgi:DNA modification methylase
MTIFHPCPKDQKFKVISQLATFLVPIDSLIPDPANARDHDERNIGEIRNSFMLFGQDQILVVREEDKVIHKGNGRWLAAKQLGWTHIAAVIFPGEKIEFIARAIADNRTSESSSWNLPILKEHFGTLIDKGWDLEELGWEADERRAILADSDGQLPGPEPQLDKIKELTVKWGTKIGQVWDIGVHRLACSNSSERNVFGELMEGTHADLVWTDPPYGVEYVGKTKDALTIQGDDLSGLGELLHRVFRNALAHSRDGAVWYVAAPSGPQFLNFAEVLTNLGIWRQTLVWVKDTLVLGRSDFHYRHEVLFYGWKPGGQHRRPPDRTQDTIWEFDRPKASTEHPTMKPVPLIRHALEMSSLSGQIVLDPFLGSGSTMVAAEQTERVCRGIEIDPGYVAVSLERMAEMGLKPTLVKGGPENEIRP